MNANRVVIGVLIILCCVVGCSDPDAAIQQEERKIEDLEVRIEALDSEIRERDRLVQQLEKENEELKKRPPRLSEKQMREIRARLARIESVSEETISISDDFEEGQAAIDEIEATHLKKMQEATEGLESVIDYFKGDASMHFDELPNLIQAMKDELTATLEENEELKKEIAELQAGEQ